MTGPSQLPHPTTSDRLAHSHQLNTALNTHLFRIASNTLPPSLLPPLPHLNYSFSFLATYFYPILYLYLIYVIVKLLFYVFALLRDFEYLEKCYVSRMCYYFIIIHLLLTQAGVGEPGCVGVEVDVVEADWLVGVRATGHPDADQGVLLLGDHQHLEDLQRAGQREVKVLEHRHRFPCSMVFYWDMTRVF